MLKYQGHVFLDGQGLCACCVGDKQKATVDPTGTLKLRTAFNSTLAIKWRGVRAVVRQAIVDQDILSMTARGLMQIANPVVQGGATRTEMFQRWFDYILGAQVLESDGSWMREYIRRSYEAGQAFAQSQVGVHVSALANDRIETLFRLAMVELQGINEAVSQKAVRAVASGILHGDRPARIARAVQSVVDSVAIPRSTALVELITIKAFSEATLDTYESAGVKRVGLVPESLLAAPLRDARRTGVTPSSGAGSRSRRGEGPGGRTVQRIKRHERGVESALAGALVNVETAGDENVCKVCRKIARKGPYKINKARSLIPAHPRCRCIFVPTFTGDGIYATGRNRSESAIAPE